MLLFTSLKRGKFAMFLIIMSVLGIVMAIADASELPVSGAFGVAIIYILLAAFLLRKEIRYFMTPADQVWSRWNNCATSEAQRIRMGRALSGQLTVGKLDERGKCALFVGGRGKKYRTTLERCTCPDFAERGVPCKHMYKLADELHLSGLPDPIINYDEA